MNSRAKELLARLSETYTIEITPRESAGLDALAEVLRPGTGIYITALPGAGDAELVRTAREVVDAGFVAIPHIAARAYRSIAEVNDVLVRLVERADVTEVLVIAGSMTKPAGTCQSALEIVRSGILEASGVRRVGFAGHPEGIPGVPRDALAAALKEKNDFAVDSGLDVYLVTQFCFHADPYLRWERAIRADGNRLPIMAGVPGVASVGSLLKFGVACGVGPSLEMLRRKGRSMSSGIGMRTFDPASLIEDIVRSVVGEPESLYTGIHVFPFGNVVKSVRSLERFGRVETGLAHGDDGRH